MAVMTAEAPRRINTEATFEVSALVHPLEIEWARKDVEAYGSKTYIALDQITLGNHPELGKHIAPGCERWKPLVLRFTVDTFPALVNYLGLRAHLYQQALETVLGEDQV